MTVVCGIAGILCPTSDSAFRRTDLDRELTRPAEALRHRGPDATATERLENAGLAHTRLSILDRSATGVQPRWSPDRHHVIAYNGEVYNFAGLRAGLETSGERRRREVISPRELTDGTFSDPSPARRRRLNRFCLCRSLRHEASIGKRLAAHHAA